MRVMNEPLPLRNIRTAEQAAAQRVKRLLREQRLTMILLHGQPGAGRTSLLLATARAWRESCRIAAVTTSLGSPHDARAIAEVGTPVVSVELTRESRLDAAMVEQALEPLTGARRIGVCRNPGLALRRNARPWGKMDRGMPAVNSAAHLLEIPERSAIAKAVWSV
jgi:hypothetical protein